ncbi:MAG: sortase [Eubacteriales bacterium]|nr:sortase [Eubacteriales bacterium]
MKGRRINGRAVSTFGIVLLFCACALLFYNIWDTDRAGRSIEEAAQLLQEYRENTEEDPYLSGNMDGISGETDEETEDTDRPMPEVVIDGIAYIGNLQVPSLGLDLPVITGWNYDMLRVAPCRYTGSVYKNDMVLAAHNYQRHFGMLQSLEKGAEIRFTDMDGNEFRYTVEANEVIEPTGVEKMVSNSYDLTLFTCVPSGMARYTIRCRRIQEADE